jgi:hypothetical protein
MMLHVPRLLATWSPPPRVDAKLSPLAPAAYLALRREASGLSFDQAAERILASYARRRTASGERVIVFGGKNMGKSAARAELVALLRLAERPGVIVREKDTLERIRRGYDFDPFVYRQLATAPAKRHPRICRGCGCSDHDPCHTEDMSPCRWAGLSVCSRCTYGEAE